MRGSPPTRGPSFSFMPANTELCYHGNNRVQRRRRGWEALVKVLPGGRGHVRRGREIDDCFRTLRRRYRKKLGEPEQARNRPSALVSKARRDETGMQAMCRYAGVVQPAGELTRK